MRLSPNSSTVQVLYASKPLPSEQKNFACQIRSGLESVSVGVSLGEIDSKNNLKSVSVSVSSTAAQFPRPDSTKKVGVVAADIAVGLTPGHSENNEPCNLVAHDCGTPCRATRVALHVSQSISWIL